MTAGERERWLERLAVPAGLCADCRFLRLVAGRRGAFVRCGRAEREPGYPRYPRLPVLACGGFQPTEAEGGAPGA